MFRLLSLGLVARPPAKEVVPPAVFRTSEEETGGFRASIRRRFDRARILCLVFSSRSIPLETERCDEAEDDDDDDVGDDGDPPVRTVSPLSGPVVLPIGGG